MNQLPGCLFAYPPRSECSNCRGISPIASQEKYTPNALKRDAAIIIESKLDDAQCAFRPGRSTTDQIFGLHQNVDRSWEYAKNFQRHVLSTSRNHTTGFLVKSFGEWCVCTVLKAACYCASSHCIPAQTCVRVDGVKSQLFSVGVGLRQRFVLSPLLYKVYMNCIDSHSGVGQGDTVAGCRNNRLFLLTIWYC